MDRVIVIGGTSSRLPTPWRAAWYRGALGLDVGDEVEEFDGLGRLGRARGPEGDRIQVWEPA